MARVHTAEFYLLLSQKIMAAAQTISAQELFGRSEVDNTKLFKSHPVSESRCSYAPLVPGRKWTPSGRNPLSL